MTLPLKAYQQENVDWLGKVKRGLLADEPGLGKSRSALEGMKGLGSGKILIVAPSLVATSGVWHDEVEAWGDDDSTYHLATYSMLNDRKDMRTKKQLAAGSAARYTPIKRLRTDWRGHWDGVILDEAHYIKGRDTNWTWAAKQLGRNCDAVALLTGTPIPNWAHEVFTLLQVLKPEEGKIGHDELGSFWRWAERWFQVTPNYAGGRGSKLAGDLLGCTPKCMRRDADDPCKHYRRFAKANFGERYMRHLRAQHLDLPPIEFLDTNTPMDLDTRRSYAELRKHFATDIDEHEILAWSQGAKNVLMDKMTTSPWLLHKEGEPRGGKFEQLREDLYKRRHEPTLVFAHYRDSVEASARIATTLGLRAGYIHGGTTDKQNAALVRDFKRGQIDVLAGSLETMSEGLTLTIANTAIMLERSFKPSRNTQATYRIYRLGQDKAVQIIRYLTPNSVDMGKEALLNAKNDHQMRTLTAADYLRVA